MKRRTYLASLTASIAAFGGCTAFGKSQDESRPEYYGDENVVYEHDALDIRLRQETVHLGETAEFQITNTGNSKVHVSCKNPWALQKRSDGEWQHVTWTASEYPLLCLTTIDSGSSLVERVTLSESELEDQADEVRGTLTPGRYRLVLIGTSPYFAFKFDVLDST